MSASSKKKLRKEADVAKMTEKQAAEQKEAKKLKTYSIIFGVVIAVMLVFAVWTAVSQTVSNSGIMERSTVAVTVGDHKISNAELNIYYIDAINNFYGQYGSYASLFGLDTTLPLNEQVTNEETGATWADDFLDSAKENLRTVYTMADMAEADGYTLTEEDLASIDTSMANVALYGMYYYGYSDAESYLKAMYGNGCTEELYREYLERSMLAESYYANYAESLTYEDADLRAAEAENYNAYSSFSYNSYYISTSKFLEGGTTDEDGNTTYSDDENAAAIAAAEEAANSLIAEEIVTIEDLDAAISALSINVESETAVTSTAYTDAAYSSVNTTILEWVTDEARVAGDKAVIPYTTHSHADGETHSDDEDTSAYDTVNGYYVVFFNGSNDNNIPLVNVRHILVTEGGTYNSSTGLYDYTDDMAAAKAKAEELLAQWEAGEKTEDSFAALAVENSSDGNASEGGKYENVYPNQMVDTFNDWCFEDGRKAGDTGIVKTDYGYHVIYFCGYSDTLYRDYMITEDLRTADTTEWFNAQLENVTLEVQNLKYIPMDMVLSAG